MKEFHYTVRGSWPFPLDMLRHDCSVAASPRDQELINALSGDCASDLSMLKDQVDIHLVIPHGSRMGPNSKRWESFGWSVPTDEYRNWEKQEIEKEEARHTQAKSAIAKLTKEEIKALEWHGLDVGSLRGKRRRP